MKENLNKLSNSLQKNYPYTFICLITISALLFIWSAYDSRFLLNPDGISYMSIARQYAEGHFGSAVNALLPPFLSWLMAPLILAGLSGPVAFLATATLVALLILSLGMYLVRTQTRGNFYSTLLFWAISTTFLVHAIGFTIAPDLLIVLWVILLLMAAIKAELWMKSPAIKQDLIAAICLGAIGAFGYLTKQFFLPFFTASLLTWFLLRAFVYKKELFNKLSLKKFFIFFRVPILSFVFMMLLLLPWVVMLSAKYNQFMLGSRIGSVVTANLDGSGKAVNPTEDGYKTGTKLGLQAPPSQYAVAYGECHGCPAPGSKKQDSPKVSPDYGYYLSKKAKAFPQYLRRINSMGFIILPTVAILAWAYITRRVSYKRNPGLILAGVFWLIYFGGYAVLFGTSSFESLTRYLWPLLTLSTLILCFTLPNFWRRARTRRDGVAWLLIFATLLLPLITLLQYKPTYSNLLKSARQPVIQHIAQDLKDNNIISQYDKLASNNKRQTLYMAFILQAQSYGSITRDGKTEPKFTDEVAQSRLKAYGIDYYIHFSKPTDEKLSLGNSGAQIVKVYHLKKLICENYRGAPGVACDVTVVKLQ